MIEDNTAPGSGGIVTCFSAQQHISAEDAADLVRPGNSIYIGSACGTPGTIIRALEARRPTPPDVTVRHFLTTGAYEGEEGLGKTRFYHRVYYIGTDMAPFIRNGNADYVPIRLSEIPRLLERGRLPVDIAFVQVSPPDENGYVSLGVSVDITRTVLRHADKIVAEVNPNMPRSFGDSFLHVSEIDHAVSVDTPLPEYMHDPTDIIAQRIGRYIAGIIEDGSTLQVGLGRIPNQALYFLKDRRNLGIHTDVVSGEMVELLRSGAVTGRSKSLHRGKVVASFAIGNRELYDLIDLNPMFHFLPIEEVCNPAVIAQNHNMVSITQAFGIDLTGQTAIDQFDGAFYGGVSTQPDFMRGASRAWNGKPIICMTAVADNGRSRIRPYLTRHDGVGIPRSDVHYVVTEYGIAYLFGKSIQERALALIEIAHPDFRADLLEEAKKLGYVDQAQKPVAAGTYDIEAERRDTLRDGREVMIRPARASDARALQMLFHRLPTQDVYTRFFRRLKFLSLADAQTLCNVDSRRDVAFVAVTGPREDETLVASGCYFLDERTMLAETAFIVDPDWQGTGLGSALQKALRDHAEENGLRGFTAEILPNNEKMLKLAKAASSLVTMDYDEDCYHVTMLFEDEEAEVNIRAARPAE